MDALKNIVFLGILSSCMGSRLAHDLDDNHFLPQAANGGGESNPGQASKKFLSGKFRDTNGSLIDLALKGEQKPTVVIFAQDTCEVCKKEALDLAHHIAKLSEPDLNINLYSILVGADPEDAQYWKDNLRVQWAVGATNDLDFFSRYCSQRLTPCTIIALPGRGIVYSHTGIVSPEDIEGHTGPIGKESRL